MTQGLNNPATEALGQSRRESGETPTIRQSETHRDSGRGPGATTRIGQVLSFADALPPARDQHDELLREQLDHGDPAVSASAALELASAYAPIAPKAAAGLLLRAAKGTPIAAGRALLRLARLAYVTERDDERRRDVIREYLDRAQQVTALHSDDRETLDPEWAAVRMDIASALGLAGSLDAALRILLNIEGLLRKLDDADGWGAPQDEPFRRLAALVNLRLGELQTETDPHAADGHLERAVMLGTGSLQATAALRRGVLLEHHAGGLGPEIERQYMLAIDLKDPYASPLALVAMGDILWESRRCEKAREFWQNATIMGDADILRRVERRMRGTWQREKHAFDRDEVDVRLDYARPLQDVTPSTELGRVASGRAPDAPKDDGQVRPVVVVGAGTGGHYLLPALAHGYNVVGFVDDDPTVRSVRGYRVLGSTADLGRILRAHREVAQVIFAIPTAPGTTRLRVLRTAHCYGVEVVSLPSMFELRHGHSLLAQLRPFEVHETYGDTPWDVDRDVQHQVRGRRVAIVGASTVLGAEVARRVAHGQPRHLLLIDEPSVPLMSIAGEIRQLRGVLDCEARIVDYAAEMELTEALTTGPSPEIVFYCGGAHHAPPSVMRSSHAARANVLAARTVALAAREAGCSQLVMASADRAGHRSDAYDMTKALAEIAALEVAKLPSPTASTEHRRPRSIGKPDGLRVSILRLPNLWAKDGELVGRLTEQLRHGGPLEVKSGRKRCFAPTWHAAQTMLRLLGGKHDSGIFALGGGEIVEIRELAERLLLVHGLVASRDIRIVSTSRPDEKASLRLWGRHETCASESVAGAVEIQQREELYSRLRARVKPLLDALAKKKGTEVDKALEVVYPVESEDDRTAMTA